MLAARPQIDRINRIVRRWRANVAQRYAHIPRAGFSLYCVQDAERQSFRRLDARPDRCAESQKQLAGGDSRKNLTSEIRTEKRRHQHRNDNISRDREASDGKQAVQTPVMKKDGTKTARIQSIARSRGICTSLLASSTATALPRPAPRWL